MTVGPGGRPPEAAVTRPSDDRDPASTQLTGLSEGDDLATVRSQNHHGVIGVTLKYG
jgi:hypothetical protein